MKTLLKRAVPLLSLLFWILVWLLLALLLNKPLLLPTPMAVAKKLFVLAGEGDFWLTVVFSLLRIAAGIISALILGTLLALLTVRFSLFHHLFAPPLEILKTTPVAAVIFLLLLFMGRDTVPLFIAFAMALPIVWSNVREGLLSLDPALFEMAAVFRVPTKRRFSAIVLPSVLPYLLAACRAAFGLAFKAGVAAEVLAVPERSLGRAIYESKLYLQTEELFAYTLTVVLLSVVIERLVRLLLPKKCPHKGENGIWSN